MKNQLMGSWENYNFKLMFFTALIISFVPIAGYAGDLKTAKPEIVGISSERLARMDAFMQEQIDNKTTGGISLCRQTWQPSVSFGRLPIRR